MNSLTRKSVQVEIQISDSSTLKGTVVIERTSRLSDVLNSTNKNFIVLTDEQKVHHIINKNHIVKVIELEEIL